jgi:hypothetical protein
MLVFTGRCRRVSHRYPGAGKAQSVFARVRGFADGKQVGWYHEKIRPFGAIFLFCRRLSLYSMAGGSLKYIL